MKTFGVAGLALVIALAPMGCKKKAKGDDGDKQGGEPSAMADMGGDTMALDMAPDMAPDAMQGDKPLMAGIDKGDGMVVMPKGPNPLSGVDISKGFGEGWFGQGGAQGGTPPAAPPATPPAADPAAPPATPPVAPPVAPPAADPATPPAAPPATPPAAPPVAPPAADPAAASGFATYVHPDKSFQFRYPQGWTPQAQVGQQNGIPVVVIQVQRQVGLAAAGSLGALAFINPQAPNSQTTCQQMVAFLKQQNTTLQVGNFSPLQQTGLFMFQAQHTEGANKIASVGICGTAGGKVMFTSWVSIAAQAANQQVGNLLGQILMTFTGDLLKS